MEELMNIVKKESLRTVLWITIAMGIAIAFRYLVLK